MIAEAELPWSEEAEVSVLGAPFVDSDALDEAREVIQPEDFFRSGHRLLFAAMCELHDAGEAVDPVTLRQRLADSGDLERAGGPSYIAEILHAVPTAANVSHHARIVADKAQVRRLIKACQLTVRDALESNGTGPGPIVQAAEQRILAAADTTRSGDGFQPTNEAIWEAMELIEQESKSDGGLTGVPSGIPSLDRMTSGMHPGDMTVLAGRPSMGKSALGMSVAMHAASRGHVTAFASLEMSKSGLVKRALASRAGLDLLEIRRSQLTEADYKALADAAGWLDQLPLWLDDAPGNTVPALRSNLRRLAKREDLALVVVDYLGRMEGEGRNRVQQVSAISRGLKSMARELDCHVIAVAQLSRKPEHREPPRPVLSDLRDSGGIEQDADVALLIWRPEYYFDDSTPDDQWAKWADRGELIVAKQRNGPTGKVDLRWDAATTTFTELVDQQRGGPKPWQ